MTITTETFRRAEAALLAAKISSADVLMSTIALAMETIGLTPHPDDSAVPVPITIRVAALAERLGWDLDVSTNLLVQASEDMRDSLGFRLFSHEDVEGDEGPYTSTTVPVRARLAGQLTSILRGTALQPVARRDARAMLVDRTSTAMLDLIVFCTETGGAVLLREADVAGEREAELAAVAATIADHPRIAGPVVVAGSSALTEDRVSPAGAIVCALLHGAAALVLLHPLFDPPIPGDDEDASDHSEPSNRRIVHPWQPSSSGARALSLLTHVPIAVVVPVCRNIVLTPHAAAAFVTAIGPLRRDRVAAAASIQALAAGRLSQAVSERLVDLWDGRSERARTSLDAVARMLDGPTKNAFRRRAKRGAIIGDFDATTDQFAFSAAAEAMAQGIAPHVWSPMKRQDKAPAAKFHRELFVCEPDATLLFSERLREIPGVRVLLTGESGVGKSAAAASVATEVLGMASRDLRMTDILYHKLGELERAIAAVFREARERQEVLIIDEADSIAQDRGSASSNAVHLVTAMTNALLLELDRHTEPVLLLTNYTERLDAAVRRRFDLAFDVKPIPEDREAIAFRLILELDPPEDFAGIGNTVIADYVGTKRVLQLQRSGGTEAAVAAIARARDVRLGHYEAKTRKKFGF